MFHAILIESWMTIKYVKILGPRYDDFNKRIFKYLRLDRYLQRKVCYCESRVLTAPVRLALSIPLSQVMVSKTLYFWFSKKLIFILTSIKLIVRLESGCFLPRQKEFKVRSEHVRCVSIGYRRIIPSIRFTSYFIVHWWFTDSTYSLKNNCSQ